MASRPSLPVALGRREAKFAIFSAPLSTQHVETVIPPQGLSNRYLPCFEFLASSIFR